MNRSLAALIPAALLILGFALLTIATADKSNRVPRAKYFFSPSAAPLAKLIAVNLSERIPEGEIVNGFPTLLDLDHDPVTVKRLSTSQSQDTNTQPQWTSDGSRLIFVTNTGIYSTNIETAKSRVLREGAFEGLAISADDSKLAFWNSAPASEHSYSLVVIDLNSNKEVRSWNTPNFYSADQYGFEIAFAPDGNSLFARTYDTEGTTPLKQFDLASACVRMVSENCSGLAASKNALYFVDSTGHGSSLWRIGNGTSQPKEVLPSFPYDDLMVSGTRRWLVARELRTARLALVDTTKDQIQTITGACDSITVLANDEIVYFREGILGTAASVCLPPPGNR
jgi:hypothetical protein